MTEAEKDLVQQDLGSACAALDRAYQRVKNTDVNLARQIDANYMAVDKLRDRLLGIARS